jgi:uncharacterized membrane protein
MIAIATLLLSAVFLFAGSLLLGLACAPFLIDYTLSRVAAPVAFVLVFQFVEHFVGLGNIAWMSPLIIGGLAYAVMRSGGFQTLKENLDVELAAAAGFFYCFAWRFAFPDIDQSSEKMADYGFILNYMRGSTLPPLDGWLPPLRFDVYYALQHYAAALAGRLLALGPGVAYHLGYCLLVSLIAAAAYRIAAVLTEKKAYRALTVAALFLGGTGAAVLTPFMSQVPPPLHASMRFIGSYAPAPPAPTPFGTKVAALVGPEGPDLPVEIFSYLVYLGDYHAPLGGFLLLALALLGMLLVEKNLREDRETSPLLYGLILSTIPVGLITNTWISPLLAVLIISWIWHPLLGRRASPLGALLVVGSILILVYPYLSHLSPNTLGNNDGLKLVRIEDRPSFSSWAIVFWPVIALIGIGASLRDERRTGQRWALAWLAVLLFAELFYVDDIYSGKFNRFNTYLKWMPFVYNGVLLSLGPICLSTAPKLRRRAAAAVLVLVCVYALPLGRFYTGTPKAHPGRMEGDAWLTQDPALRSIVEHLSRLSEGTTLEFPDDQAFARAPALTMACGQPSFIGWPGHEQLWRGGRFDIQARYDDARRFYAGDPGTSLRWLETNKIRYIIWQAAQNGDPKTFQRISDLLGTSYLWHETYRAGDFRVGFWEKAP